MSEKPIGGEPAGSIGNTAGVTRRRVLAGGGAVAVAGLAGCLGTRNGPVPEPEVTSDRIGDGWRLLDESESTVFEQSYGPVTVTALEHTRIYEYVSVAEALSETVGASGSPVVFFATRIDVRPAIDSLPAGIGRDRLMSEVETAAVDAFRSQLNASGIENVEIVDRGTSTVETGHTATTWQLGGEFTFDGEVPLPDGSARAISETVEIESRLGVWHDGTDVLVAGGAYPAEPLTQVIDDALPNLIDAETFLEETADAEAREALATEPGTFDEEVSALLVSVE
ncbi:hypothetical protein C471_07816 [Halorubrum saccharovorum DSM 1137]|uniref:Uncharacterized protein n=1 Tax=Halorubrum saccharovorum DSM 1137 TaxID=1227484 RepID=M0E0V8_9EURY|nr:hypothetical protein [Halorubrum saccharovorum]ELZ40673.1 hypothetical protein C471_07816 [Halorubrum saccharovorum DSM 1137]